MRKKNTKRIKMRCPKCGKIIKNRTFTICLECYDGGIKKNYRRWAISEGLIKDLTEEVAKDENNF